LVTKSLVIPTWWLEREVRNSTAQPDRPCHCQTVSGEYLAIRKPPTSLRHQLPNRPPEITAHAPTTLPSIRVRESNHIRRVRRSTLAVNRVWARRVEIELVRRRDSVSRPVAGTVHRDVVGRYAVGDGVGDGWVVGGDEVAPSLLESGGEIGAVELAGVVEVSGRFVVC
jgi:hypothetical protein